MSFNIHCYVEKRINGVWQKVSEKLAPIVPYSYFSNLSGRSWNPGKNYVLFGLLAGVKDYDIQTLSEPRGFPTNLSESIRDIWNQGIADDSYHTPSYYSLFELLSYKDGYISMSGLVDISSYEEFLKTKKPKKWYKKYVPSEFEIISNKEMERVINLISFLGEKSYLTNVSWDIPIKSTSDFFWSHIVPAMEKLDSNSNNVRFIFWFSST